MSTNSKQSSPKVTKLAATTLTDPSASKIAKSLAASVLSQAHSPKQSGAELESAASKVMNSDKYAKETKTLAASVLSQSNKER